jgi:hypothetical protein
MQRLNGRGSNPIVMQPSLSDGRIVIPDVLWFDDMVGKPTERCEIQPDRTQVTLSVMIRTKYEHVAGQIRAARQPRGVQHCREPVPIGGED